jgi:hypothetical protein
MLLAREQDKKIASTYQLTQLLLDANFGTIRKALLKLIKRAFVFFLH